MITDCPVLLTSGAIGKVKTLLEEEGNPNLKLRVFIQGGGCSGYQYGFTFAEEVEEDDTVVSFPLQGAAEEGDGLVYGQVARFGAGTADLPELERLQLLIDPLSYQYLDGAQIDYKIDIHGAQFVIKNPNAKTSCGCGSSFSV